MPVQDDVRVVVLNVILWPDRISLSALVESDRKEIEEPHWEEDQVDMFGLVDDLGTEYKRGGASGQGDDDLHVWKWETTFQPAVPQGAKALTVTHIAGSVLLTL
jgi:hypothetical protein